MTVSCFETPHDSKMSVGYRIEFEHDGRVHSLGVATDIGCVTDEIFCGLRGCEAVVLESNHDVDMLRGYGRSHNDAFLGRIRFRKSQNIT